MEVRPGYKQTEVGAIPQDWSVAQLGQLATFITSGSRGWAQFYSNSGALFIRSQNIGGGSLCFDDVQHVSPPAGAEGNRTRVERNDLLITITGNSVGNVALIEELFGEAYISQHVGLVRLREPTTGAYINRYLSPKAPGNSQIAGSQSGQSKPGLNLQNLRDFRIAFPPTLQEINAISDVLQDVDALLNGLTRLIAKKRNLKQATMQQLLTGKTRLPGFQDEWGVASLDLITSRSTGVWGRNTVDERNSRRANIIRAGDISQDGNLIATATRYVSPDEFDKAKCVLDDLVITTSGNGLGKLWWCDGRSDTAASNFVRVLRPNTSKANGRFLYFALRTAEGLRQLQEHTATSAYPNLRPTYFSSSWIPLPPYPEQSAIATILSDMDTELAALDARLTKTRALKQAMMSELLTGKTRLPT